LYQARQTYISVKGTRFFLFSAPYFNAAISLQRSFPTRFHGSDCERPTNYVEHEPLNQQTYKEWKRNLLAVTQYNTSTLSYLVF